MGHYECCKVSEKKHAACVFYRPVLIMVWSPQPNSSATLVPIKFYTHFILIEFKKNKFLMTISSNIG
jgi:hypothetical protein